MRTGIFEKFEACQMLVISPIFSPGHYKWCVPSNVRRIPPKIGPANLRVIYIWRARLKCVLIRVVYLRPMWMLTLRYLLSRSVLCDQLTTGIDQIRRTQLESNSGDNVSHVLILILIIHQGCFGSMAGSCFSKWGVGLNLIHSVLAAWILCTTVLAVCILYTGNAPAMALMRGHLYCLSFLPVINLPHEFYMHRGKQVEENLPVCSSFKPQ